MNLLIGADLVPTERNQTAFAAGTAEALVDPELLQLLQAADYRIFNLEVPLTDWKTLIEKNGPALIAPEASVAGYKALEADLLCLSNNHILDQGVRGFADTVRVLSQAGIATVGGGENLEAAAKPYIFNWNDRKVGVYACCEYEFSIAGEDTPGANPFDPLECPDRVASLKAQCDYVIVLYHGGKEHYRYPSPGLQKVCRKLVEKGADLVLCQHSHCIGCYEEYGHGTILYGQGNFLFDRSSHECWQTGLLVALEPTGKISWIPLEKKGATVALAQGKAAEKILEDFENRSKQISQPGFVQQNYRSFAKTQRGQYLLSISPQKTGSLFFRGMNRLTGGLWSRMALRGYGKTKCLRVENYIACQAHQELLLEALRQDPKA